MHTCILFHSFLSCRAPECAKIRSKMVFASSTDAVKKKLNFNGPGKHCNDSSDLLWADILDNVKGH